MFIYIHKGQIFNFGVKLTEDYGITRIFNESWEKFYELSSSQLSFYQSNPTATVEEILKESMNPVIPDLESVRSLSITLLEEYDRSDKVNQFTINGIPLWLDRETRISLRDSIKIEKEVGKTNTVLWFGINSLEINCDLALALLSQLELYALECYNRTAQHRTAISNLQSIPEIEQYDFTVGYPEKLNFTT